MAVTFHAFHLTFIIPFGFHRWKFFIRPPRKIIQKVCGFVVKFRSKCLGAGNRKMENGPRWWGESKNRSRWIMTVPFLIGTFAVSLVVVRTKSTAHLIFCVRVKGRNFDYYVNIRIINRYPISKIYNALDDWKLKCSNYECNWIYVIIREYPNRN